MEVLFEYRGSRRQLTVSSGENLIDCITTELHRIGRSRAQKWSPQWESYLDVNQTSEISDGDKLAVVIKPKPPSKFLLLCCCCSSVQNEPQVQGVPRKKKNAVRKNEEIQALDYVFNVESGRQSHASECDSHSLALSETKETDLKEGEQYIRAESGRASWKLVPMKQSSDTSPAEIEPQQLQDNLPEHSDTHNNPESENKQVQSPSQELEIECTTESDADGDESTKPPVENGRESKSVGTGNSDNRNASEAEATKSEDGTGKLDKEYYDDGVQPGDEKAEEGVPKQLDTDGDEPRESSGDTEAKPPTDLEGN